MRNSSGEQPMDKLIRALFALTLSLVSLALILVLTPLAGRPVVRSDNSDAALSELHPSQQLLAFNEVYSLPVPNDEMVTILTFHGRYAAATDDTEDWKIEAKSKLLGDTGRFDLICLDDGQAAFKTYYGRYITAMDGGWDPSWVLRAETASLNDWEKLTLIDPQTGQPLQCQDVLAQLGQGSVVVAFKTFHNRYVTAMWQDWGWVLRAETTTLGDWEKFTLSDKPEWDTSLLISGTLEWSAGWAEVRYRLQENVVTGVLTDNHWIDVYTGTATAYDVPHISPVWYRVCAEKIATGTNEILFTSGWSDVQQYNPPAVLIDKSTLMTNQALMWTHLSHAAVYTVESVSYFTGPWTTTLYVGDYPTAPLPASVNTWYRVRAGWGTEESEWSPPQWKPDPIAQDIFRTYGTTIRKGPLGEIGKVAVLRGVNLGNYLLIEPWLNGWVSGTITATWESDYDTLRQILASRFGQGERDALLQTYRDSYLTDADFDILMRMGVNLVRLPIYYGELQDDDGNLIPEGFDKLDRVVEACADRGMYVLLDLHGAPGAQSSDCWTGQCNYNKLFQGAEGERLRCGRSLRTTTGVTRL
jgi:hypothetical protein